MSVKKKMLFDKGDKIQWAVSSPGYYPQSGQLTINEDTTININLLRNNVVFSWDGGGTKTVWFGNKKVTSTSPILIGNDGPITMIDYDSNFSDDYRTKNVFLDAVGLPSNVPYIPILFKYDTNVIENIEIINSSHITEFGNAFEHMQHIKTVSVDTSGATDITYMFSGSVIEDPPYLNTSNVTDAEGMFFECANLKNIPLYDFSNVMNMRGTFQLCPNITSIPPLDTHNVTNISFCFTDSTKLKTVPLLDFSNVTSTDALFSKCTSLTDVGGFTGLKVDIDFSDSPLTHASAVNIINNLAVSSGHRVQFKKSTFDTLTPAEIAKATDKGWTITYV